MFYRAFIATLFLLVAFVLSPAASAQTSSIRGDVRGVNGQPLKGAEIRIERKDKPSALITAKTDSKGNYACNGLSAGVYRVSVAVDGAVRSAANVKTVAGTARVDFDMKPTAARTVKHYAWIQSDVGSHLGGRWVEVDTNGTPIARMWNADTASAELAREMLRRQTGNRDH